MFLVSLQLLPIHCEPCWEAEFLPFGMLRFKPSSKCQLETKRKVNMMKDRREPVGIPPGLADGCCSPYMLDWTLHTQVFRCGSAMYHPQTSWRCGERCHDSCTAARPSHTSILSNKWEHPSRPPYRKLFWHQSPWGRMGLERMRLPMGYPTFDLNVKAQEIWCTYRDIVTPRLWKRGNKNERHVPQSHLKCIFLQRQSV